MQRLSLRLSMLWFGVTCAAWLVGCASNDAAKKVPVATSTGAVRLDDVKFNATGFTKRDVDLNRDGKPDAYQFVVVENDGNTRVVRKEIDVNFDGRIDLIRSLDDRGELVEERIDGDFDGRIDVVILFQKGIIAEKRYDTNFDGATDMWRYFEKGAVVRE
jgi:hypothetical protein